jgi:hypothetical protein
MDQEAKPAGSTHHDMSADYLLCAQDGSHKFHSAAVRSSLERAYLGTSQLRAGRIS